MNPNAMQYLVVEAHPSPESFNRQVASTIAETVRACGHAATLRDLYAIGFDPVLRADERPGPDHDLYPDVATEIELLSAADVLVLVFPIWFGMPPAMIKGYVDRVMGAQTEPWRLREGLASPALAGKRLVVVTSSGTTLPWLEGKGQWVALSHAFEEYLVDIFGMRGSEHLHFDAVVAGLSEQVVREHLETTRERFRRICALEADHRRAERMRELVGR